MHKSFFNKNRRLISAVDNVSFAIKRRESFGIVGESGSGKSTIARLIAGLIKMDNGKIKIFDHEIDKTFRNKNSIDIRRELQMIFQDPYSSLNARMRIGDIIAEPIRYFKTASNTKEESAIITDILDYVGLSNTSKDKFPHEFSGGQRQRIAIARALAAEPKLLLADEPTGNLDSDTSKEVFSILTETVKRNGMAAIIATHNTEFASKLDRIIRIESGKLV